MHKSMGEGDRAAEAAALLGRGREFVLSARYREAYESLMAASKLAHEGPDIAEESRSLSLLAYAAAALGHAEEAIETAMLASQLADESGNTEARLMALNYLGVALLWNGSHEGAEAVLKPAFELARSLHRPTQCVRPQLNRCFNEAYRQIGLRHLEKRRPDPERLLRLMAALEERSPAEQARSQLIQGLWQWLQGVSLAWQSGSSLAAKPAQQALTALCEAQPNLGLLPAMLQWMICELALVDEQPQAALAAASRLMALCERMQQHPLQRIALRLSCELHEQQGQTAQALASLRQLQLSEHRLRQVSMSHRREAAALRLELRQHKREVRSLRNDAQQLQRLSMEDPLTGLANRRGLEQQLNAALTGHGRPESGAMLYVSMVDVNGFKGVNDRHSHRVGDQVLQTLAMLFQQQLRSQDMAGRWGGDEFVLAFWALDDLQAQAVVTRLREAVSGYNWHLLAPGLKVGISLGLARAGSDDELQDLLLRSDQGMYAHKRACQSLGQPDNTVQPGL